MYLKTYLLFGIVVILGMFSLFCSQGRWWIKGHSHRSNHSPKAGSDEWKRGQTAPSERCGETEGTHHWNQSPAEGCQGDGGESEGQPEGSRGGHGQNGEGSAAEADTRGQGRLYGWQGL